MTMHRTSLASLTVVVALLAAAAAVAAGPELDPGLAKYTKVEGLRGTLNAAGSDTMLELQTLMAEDFRKLYPQVKIQIEGKGSSTAPPALIEGTVQLGNMSRAMKNQEIDAFEEKFGFEPTRFDVALDTLAVSVNKDNPVAALSLPQVDAIFSKTRQCGLAGELSTWGQLGLTGSWQTAPISLYGRNAASGTYGYFKDHALCKGDFKDSVKEQPGSASVVQGIEKDPYGIGYSGIGYVTSGVRAVPIAPADGQPAVAALAENAANGSYPLARFLHVYVNKAPGQPLDRLTAEYLRFILSSDGQRVVAKAGFDPLDAVTAAEQLAKIGD
jgi:phosphate transport system substrate-binding protein